MDNRNYDQESMTVEVKSRSRLFALLSLLFGILSIMLGLFGAVGVIFGAISIALAVISRVSMGYFDSLALIGLIAAIIGVAAGVSFLIANELFGVGFMSLG